MSSFGQQLSIVFETSGQLCVGLDPSDDQLKAWGLPRNPEGLREFGLAMIDACASEVGIIKPQVAFFESYGPKGFEVLAELLLVAKQARLLVVADAKRGDIGSTMNGYTKAWLSKEAIFSVDALTLSPYLGLETLRPTIDTALQNEKGVFLLAATSNPEARQLQSAVFEGETVAGSVAKFASSFNAPALSSVGIVVGATTTLKGAGIFAEDLSHTPILMPGFGAQGVSLESAGEIMGELAGNTIANVSRSVAGDSREGLALRLVRAKQALAKGLTR